MDSAENINEFLTIIQLLNDGDIGVLHEVIMMENELEQIKCLRTLRFVITNYPQILNAYSARVLVIKPNDYITNEIVSRYKKQFLIY